MAHSSRNWTGARTPSSRKRVRQSARRHEVLQPRRSAARTYVKNALEAAANGDGDATQAAVAAAASALDRAAKVGAIHPNAAARRKSRLMLRVGAAIDGAGPEQATRSQRQVGKAAAAKAAKARIAAGKATKAKGEQTAAGKARAALSKSARTTEPKTKGAKAEGAKAEGAKSSGTKSGATKSSATKATAKGTKRTSKAAKPAEG